MDLLHFRLEVANNLLKVGQERFCRKRGRPSNSNSPSTFVYTKRSNERRPTQDAQHDKVDHMPFHDGKKEATRCKMNCKIAKSGAGGRTHFYCGKCNVHLCITKERNCFDIFHSIHFL